MGEKCVPGRRRSIVPSDGALTKAYWVWLAVGAMIVVYFASIFGGVAGVEH